MTRRFVALAARSPDQANQLAEGAARARALGLQPSLRTEELAVFTSKTMGFRRLASNCGIVVGDMFHRDVSARSFGKNEGDDATDEITRVILENRTHTDMWGDYVAIYVGSDGFLRLFHSPCGSVNLFYLDWRGVLLVSSDAHALLEISGRRRSLNSAVIAANLIWDDISGVSTCIEDVHEIRGGETGTWSNDIMSIEALWSPWQFTQSEFSIWAPDEAVDLVRREIHRCVSARKKGGARYAIDLSGGLDSSIIAAACVAAGIDAVGINLFNPGTEGDERQFAQSVASHLNLDLHEAIPSADDVDLDTCARRHLPRPYVRSFAQAMDQRAQEISTRLGVTAFMNGGGGDSVFCHLQSSAPVVDAIRSPRRAPSAFRTAYEVSRAAQCNVRDVANKAVRKLLRPNHPDRIPADIDFVTPACLTAAMAQQPLFPPAHQRPLPGKIEQVHGIYRSLYNLNGFARSDHMKGVFPLLSQPLIEACLRIPSWLSVGEGRNRLIARYAIEPELPATPVWRISKGGLGQLQRDIMRKNRKQVRDKLLSGYLAREGLIDRKAIEAELADDMSYRVESLYRLMRLCDVETWCYT